MYQVVLHYESESVFAGSKQKCIEYVVDNLLPDTLKCSNLGKEYAKSDSMPKNLKDLYNNHEFVYQLCHEICNAEIIEVLLPQFMYGIMNLEHQSMEMTAWSQADCYLWYIDNRLVEEQKRWIDYDHLQDFGVNNMNELRNLCRDGKPPQGLDDYMEESGFRYIIVKIPLPN